MTARGARMSIMATSSTIAPGSGERAGKRIDGKDAADGGDHQQRGSDQTDRVCAREATHGGDRASI